ncbi:30S ribosomal protein S8 [Candidatus Peregrinibacteria bacterium]|nr:30S ribosomal protein S8 [Candidatus Peregrinibacteria bacterium]
MVTDPIADLLTRIRNGVKARQSGVVMPYSRLKMNILEVMKKRAFIQDYEKVMNGPREEIKVTFNPQYKELNLKRISKPGQRIYVKSKDIFPVLNGYGIGIISTSNGVTTDEEARKNGTGGEYICEIW